MQNEPMQVLVVGGGAAGYFAAIRAKEVNPLAEVVLLEAGGKPLRKVAISGGGRCNVTHHEFDPNQLVKNYPRGNRELRGVFARFQPSDTVAWFQARGVALKTESDGRMFPTTDQSSTIIDCLVESAESVGVIVRLGERVESVEVKD